MTRRRQSKPFRHAPWLSRFGLGRLPGDLTVRYKGRLYYLPLTSTILLSLLLTLITRIL